VISPASRTLYSPVLASLYFAMETFGMAGTGTCSGASSSLARTASIG
jgi:hypothetical protein